MTHPGRGPQAAGPSATLAADDTEAPLPEPPRMPDIGEITYTEVSPPDDLEEFVQACWTVEGSAGDRIRVTPDACTDLIGLGDGRVLFVGPMLAGGLATLWRPVTHGVRFHPGTLLALEGHPELRGLRDRDAIIDAGLPPGGGAPSLVAFARRLRDDGRLSRDATVDAVLSAMERTLSARPDLGAVYHSLGVSERSVQRLFRRFVGLTPKQAARVLRQSRLTMALRDEDDGLAALARAHGYADQAHMSREYRELAGLPPGRYRIEAADVGFVQDARPLTRTIGDGTDS